MEAVAPSVFVTRWTATTGKPGSRMLVNFQMSSPSPIVQVKAEVDDVVVASGQGADLAAFGSMWLTTPAVGTHKLSVWAQNACGLSREAVSTIPLRVK